MLCMRHDFNNNRIATQRQQQQPNNGSTLAIGLQHNICPQTKAFQQHSYRHHISIIDLIMITTQQQHHSSHNAQQQEHPVQQLLNITHGNPHRFIKSSPTDFENDFIK